MLRRVGRVVVVTGRAAIEVLIILALVAVLAFAWAGFRELSDVMKSHIHAAVEAGGLDEGPASAHR